MRYLLLPKDDEIAGALDSALPGEGRVRLLSMWKATEPQRLAKLRDNLPGVKVIATPTRQTPTSGITVLEADDDEASRQAIDDAYPGQQRVKDFPISLIAPPDIDDAAGGTGAGIAAGSIDVEGPWHLDQIGLLRARQSGFKLKGEGATVAILDTGVADIPELQDRIAENRTFDDQTYQYLKASVVDSDWHGTHVAGIIAGKTVGVAPGAKLVSLTMLPQRQGSFLNYVFAFEYTQTQPDIRILNVSAGKSGQHPQMRHMAKIAQRLDVLAILAIGNEGPDTSRSPGNYPEVLSVGAMDEQGKVWSGSGGGLIDWDGKSFETPSLVAPGVKVVSCLPDETFRAETGTSMAAPVVAGIAALLVGRYPDIPLADLRNDILSACISLNLEPVRQGRGAVRLPTVLLNG